MEGELSLIAPEVNTRPTPVDNSDRSQQNFAARFRDVSSGIRRGIGRIFRRNQETSERPPLESDVPIVPDEMIDMDHRRVIHFVNLAREEDGVGPLSLEGRKVIEDAADALYARLAGANKKDVRNYISHQGLHDQVFQLAVLREALPLLKGRVSHVALDITQDDFDILKDPSKDRNDLHPDLKLNKAKMVLMERLVQELPRNGIDIIPAALDDTIPSVQNRVVEAADKINQALIQKNTRVVSFISSPSLEKYLQTQMRGTAMIEKPKIPTYKRVHVAGIHQLPKQEGLSLSELEDLTQRNEDVKKITEASPELTEKMEAFRRMSREQKVHELMKVLAKKGIVPEQSHQAENQEEAHQVVAQQSESSPAPVINLEEERRKRSRRQKRAA